MTKYQKFYNQDFADALEACQNAGNRALSMPEIADLKIDDDFLWNEWYSSVSLKVTGRMPVTDKSPKGGTSLVLYVHVPNHFSYPENIREARAGLINGAGILPQPELEKLADLSDKDGTNGVFRLDGLDYNALKNSISGVILVEHALKHPQVIPFLGGRERAERYLDRHEQMVGSRIGVWHNNDLQEQPVAVARPLFIGNDYNYSLDACGGFNYYGHFLGVSLNDAKGIAKKVPTLEDILALAPDFVPKIAREEYERRVRDLYQ